MLRVTMKKIEDLLYKNENIVRCHKSYFVNLNYVKNVSGNARGYFLTINNLDISIPVSRNLSINLFKNLVD